MSLFITAPLISDEDVIRIEVEKETDLAPIYIKNAHAQETKLERSYLNQIQDILAFNFNYNGRSIVVGPKDLKMGSNETLDKTFLKEHGVHYSFDLEVRNNYLTLKVYDNQADKNCFAEDIKLTGDLSKDRQSIHRSSSNIHQVLFDEKGIYHCKILYTLKSKQAAAGAGPWICDVYICDHDGANAHQITSESEYCVTPTFYKSANKKDLGSFFYVSYKIGQPKIFYRPISGGAEKRFTYLRGNQLMPAVSPNGNQIAFVGDASGNPELFIQDFNAEYGGSGKPRQITACRRGVQASPTFSPDGRSLAFVSNKQGSPRIYVMDIPKIDELTNQHKPRLITKKNYENTKPAWSPDGTKLAYIARTEGVRQVWIYDFILKKEYQLTHGPGNKENPSWAPNSLHLVFNSVGNSSCELYLVNLNQPSAIRVIPQKGHKRFPVWVEP